MAGELKHKTVGIELTQAEFEAIDLHEIDGVPAGTIIAGKADTDHIHTTDNTVTVSASGGMFTTPAEAMASITDSSADNLYAVQCSAGVFEGGVIIPKPFASLVGQANGATEIRPDGNHHAIDIGYGPGYFEIQALTVGAVPNGYAAINIDGCDDHVLINKVSIYGCDTALKIRATTHPSIVYTEYLDFYTDAEVGLDVLTTVEGEFAMVSCENFWPISGPNSLIGCKIVGPQSSISIASAGIIGNSQVGTGIYLADGAFLEIGKASIQNFEYGIYVPPTGDGPVLKVDGIVCGGNTWDVYIAHPGATGSIKGVMNKNKVYIHPDANVTVSYMDADNELSVITGDLFIGPKHEELTPVTALVTRGGTMGLYDGGELSVNSGLIVNINAGVGYAQNNALTLAKYIIWDNDTITLNPDETNYIFYDNAGAKQFSPTKPDFLKNIILGRVVTDGTGIVFIELSPYRGKHSSNYLSEFNLEGLGPIYASGSTITENGTTPRALDILTGIYYYSQNEINPSGGTAVSLITNYHSSGSWVRGTATQVSNTQYDDGTDLHNLTEDYYAKHSIYTVGKGALEKYFLVYGDNEYETLVEAEQATLSTPPPELSGSVALIASVVVKEGETNIIAIYDERPRVGFAAKGLSASADHENLLHRDSATAHDLATADKPGFMPITAVTKLAGIEVGAEVNVNADFNVTTGDALILNKPTPFALNGNTVAQTLTVGVGLTHSILSTGQTFGIDTSYGAQFALSDHTSGLHSGHPINSLFAGTNISGTVNSTIFALSVASPGGMAVGLSASTTNMATMGTVFLTGNNITIGLTTNANSLHTMNLSVSSLYGAHAGTAFSGTNISATINSTGILMSISAPVVTTGLAIASTFTGTNITGTVNSGGWSLSVAAPTPAFSINGSSNPKTFTFQDGLTQTIASTGITYGIASTYSQQFPVNTKFSGTNISGTFNSTAFALSVAAPGGGIQSINGLSATAQTITIATSAGLNSVASATNGITFGLHSNYLNASLIKTTGASTSFLAADGTYRTIEGGAGGGPTLGLSASTSNQATGGTVFLTGNNITIGLTTNANGSHTMSLSGNAAGGAGALLDRYEFPMDWYQSVSSHTVVTNSISIQNLRLRDGVTFTQLCVPMFVSGVTTTNTTARSYTISAYVVIYQSTGLTLTPVIGASKTETGTWASAASTTHFCGYRMLSFPIATSLAAGQYWVGLNMQTASSGGGNSMSIIVNNLSTPQQYVNFGSTTNATNNEGMLFGMVSTSTYNATNSSITLHQSNILKNASQLLRGNFPVILRNF